MPFRCRSGLWPRSWLPGASAGKPPDVIAGKLALVVTRVGESHLSRMRICRRMVVPPRPVLSSARSHARLTTHSPGPPASGPLRGRPADGGGTAGRGVPAPRIAGGGRGPGDLLCGRAGSGFDGAAREHWVAANERAGLYPPLRPLLRSGRSPFSAATATTTPWATQRSE